MSVRLWAGRPWWVRAALGVYLVGFLEGVGAHVVDLVRGGVHVYAGAPVPVQVFWQSLLVLDAVVVVLVVGERVAGAAAAVAVMALDLATNWYCLWPEVQTDPGRFLRPYGLLPMTLFGAFVLGMSVPLSRTLRGGMAGSFR